MPILFINVKLLMINTLNAWKSKKTTKKSFYHRWSIFFRRQSTSSEWSLLPNGLAMLQRHYPAVQLLCRSHSTVKSKSSTADPLEYKNARPFCEIPGPSLFVLLREFLLGGAYGHKSAADFISGLRQQYGDLFKMPAIYGKPSIVIAFDPEMYRTVFQNEGNLPVRQNFDSIDHHRRVHRKDFFNGLEGMLMTSGEPWSHFRTAVNPILLHPKNARLYLNKMLAVNDEFLLRVREIRDPITQEVPDNFENEIHRFAFESVSIIALDKQLGLIRRNRNNPEALKLFKSIRLLCDLAYDIEIWPISWKVVKTAKFHKLMQVADDILDILTKHINEALAEIDKHTVVNRGYVERSVVEKLLKIDKRTAIIMAMDLLLAGVDTTSSSIAGILLSIATSTDKQDKLREELRTVMPDKDSQLTMHDMDNLPYLRACIKEGIRLYPAIPRTIRTLPTDVVLGGYQIPRGVGITIASSLLLRDEKYFPKPNEFIPERWLRSPDEILTPQVSNPYVYLPFGFGTRSCAGKRIAEMELEITISRLVRNFHIGFDYPTENAFKAKFVNVPAIPLKFSFKEVED